MKKAILIGSRGQDGRCLSELLISRGYEVVGVHRESGIDIFAESEMADFIGRQKPDEIYFLAAYHHSSEQKTDSEASLWNQSLKTHVTALVYLLEAVRIHAPTAKVFYASSSLVFGPSAGALDENSVICPDTPYGMTKAMGMDVCRYYRDKYSVFVSVGILFNHESEYRSPQFLSRKITAGVAAIQAGKSNNLKLGSLSAEVDWGYARDYVDGMTSIIACPTPETFVVSSGKLHSVKQMVDLAFGLAGLRAEELVTVDAAILQRKMPARLGNHSKLKKLTGWTPSTPFDKMVEILLKAEGVEIAKR